jgi:hypothetical protein
MCEAPFSLLTAPVIYETVGTYPVDGGEMRKLAVVHAALVAAVAVALGAASSASGALNTITGGSCTIGTTTFNADFSYGPANAFNPLFVTNTDTGTAAGVFIPHTIVLNGTPIVSKSPGLDTSALRGSLVTCTFNDGATRAFVVTGILAPVPRA